MRNGGYQIVDLQDISLVKNSSVNIHGIFNKIATATKPVVLSRVTINGIEYHDMFIQPTISTTSIGFRLADYDCMISSTDGVAIITHK